MALIKYQDVPAQYKQNLLLGNGFSIGIHPNFKYYNLYEYAKNKKLLKPEDIQLFEIFKTTDFESVLRKLDIAIKVNQIYGITISSKGDSIDNNIPKTNQINTAIYFQQNFNILEERYDSVKEALRQAIITLHPSISTLVPVFSFQKLNELLFAFENIFTLNYDLLCYQAIMHKIRNDENQFVDFFFTGNKFDISNTTFKSNKHNPIHIYYLHGALHLYQTDEGETYKIIAPQGSNLINTIFDNKNRTSLFVSECDSNQKLARIKSNLYLTFCYDSLQKSIGSITIQGVSLNKSDKHIIDALNQSGISNIVYGIHPDTYNNDPKKIIIKQNEVKDIFNNKNVLFYDSSSFLEDTFMKSPFDE